MNMLSSSRTASGVDDGKSVGRNGQPADIVRGHRVYSCAPMTLTGLSTNHAMTTNHSAMTRNMPGLTIGGADTLAHTALTWYC